MKVIFWLLIPFVALAGCLSDDACSPRNPADEVDLIADYVSQNGITARQTASGLNYEITQTGSGFAAKPGDVVTLEIEGFLLDGRQFESSFDRGTPLGPFPLGQGQVISGLEEGIMLLNEGSKATMILPSSLAFGCTGNQGTIVGANEVLVFNVDILRVCTEGTISQQESDSLDSYLAENGITANATTSGLRYVVTEAGSGDALVNGDAVSVQYEGKFLDGTVFDSSTDGPFRFTLGQGQVIEGWDEGFALLKVGDKATLYIPSHLAYGCLGQGPIGGSETLIFTVEVISKG